MRLILFEYCNYLKFTRNKENKEHTLVIKINKTKKKKNLEFI